jgi:hypothetical protein
MLPHTKLFGNNRQIVLSGNQQIYMVDLVEKIHFQVYFFMPALLPEVFPKDSNVWLDVGRPPQNTFANIRKLKLLNCISMIYDQATKLFSNRNCQIVLSGNQQIYMVDLFSKEKIHFQLYIFSGWL